MYNKMNHPMQKPHRKLAPTPPMGYNTFHDIGTNNDPKSPVSVNEFYIRQVADSLVSSGMRDAGYIYLNIDDGWMNSNRDENGYIMPNPDLFPGGMKSLTDYIHGKGLKAGIYLTCGKLTYANLPGSLGFEQKDADKIAEWGFDLVKYDYRDDEKGGNVGRDSKKENYAMYEALKNNAYGREIMFSMCSHGRQNVWEWAGDIASMWRITTDVKDIWEGEMDGGWSFNKIIDDRMTDIWQYSGPGGWNDPDFLIIGNNQWWLGKDRKATKEEQRTQFSLWCLLAAPLIHGYNPARNDAYTVETLMNRELIAVDQDILGIQGRRVRREQDKGLDYWVKPLADGSFAVGLYNRSEVAQDMTIKWSDLSLPDEKILNVRDLWEHEDKGKFREKYTQKVHPHVCSVIKVTSSES